MDSLDKFADDGLEALQRAVTKALDRKRRLGQYAVFWEDDRIVFRRSRCAAARGASRFRQLRLARLLRL